jgi:hypothetical protein
MVEEKTGRGQRAGPFLLLRRCEEVEPRLGELYESWNVFTDRPSLTLFPRDSVQWQPLRPLRAWVDFDPRRDCVSLELERQPDAERTMDWVNLLTLLNLVAQRVEDSLRVKAHLAGRSLGRLTRWSLRVRWALGSPAGWAVVGLGLLALGGGLGLAWQQPPVAHPGLDALSVVLNLVDASDGVLLTDGTSPALSYPLGPPFRNQVLPPCETRKGAVEIKEGCWVELAKKPPCFDTQAEYQGKCYLPVLKPLPVPQSVKP